MPTGVGSWSRVTYGPFAWLATSSLSPAGEAAGRPRDNERQTGCGGVANSGRVPRDLARRRCRRLPILVAAVRLGLALSVLIRRLPLRGVGCGFVLVVQ